ncbi:hypothetical protein AZI86_05270 [Bdellovibrio bacteriovorus]|uniref:Uncharacterized protein n=1 Tax=Bdellovibrio bacteriovorus TaxID=959 RepID=A0A150WQ74_BDEBC|nr:hypothetical protein [Bdellovibrio bacteriovorus]KYG66457.1 hypothetical protein AZI86_05270 [Bdellovibrio bacteriovorus]
MGRNTGHGKISKKVESFPKIFIDKENDFAAIKIAKGIEHKSYKKDGFIFCEDKAGRVIEIQVLNLSKLPELLKKAS